MQLPIDQELGIREVGAFLMKCAQLASKAGEIMTLTKSIVCLSFFMCAVAHANFVPAVVCIQPSGGNDSAPDTILIIQRPSLTVTFEDCRSSEIVVKEVTRRGSVLRSFNGATSSFEPRPDRDVYEFTYRNSSMSRTVGFAPENCQFGDLAFPIVIKKCKPSFQN